ncbi:MAG: DNA-directed RNA polymerase subunit omega [Lachnospiraceae bacterium]|nr:DNA-directed RNA polymerase subunit omega [Lachnospiraceae bacterium]
MLHPSYVELMETVNANIPEGEEPIVSSRYSIVMASAKRARQIVSGDEPLAGDPDGKPLSNAVEEIYENKVQILAPGTGSAQ